jgi:hypothetical protein
VNREVGLLSPSRSGHELLRHGRFVWMRVIAMDDQVSKIPTSTLRPRFRQRHQHFAHVIAWAEFARTPEGGHCYEPSRKPHVDRRMLSSMH